MASNDCWSQRAQMANHRSILRNKPTNDSVSKSSRTGKASKLSPMSPEARRAMQLTREDSKENLPAKQTKDTMDIHHSDSLKKHSQHPNNNRHRFNNSHVIRSVVGGKPHLPWHSRGSRLQPASSQVTTAATSRSRSSLSRTYSASDNNETCYNNDTNNGTQNNDSFCNDDKFADSNGNANKLKKEQSSMQNNDDINANDTSEDYKQKYCHQDDNSSSNCKSFILVLDRALEYSKVRRLRGDITDTASLNEPGKVRALDGGRLANAQEVVVNVCHEDDRQLIFHDEDDESVGNAKRTSEIRVNIWMEYNEKFRNDDLDLRETDSKKDHFNMAKNEVHRISGNSEGQKKTTNKMSIAPRSSPSSVRSPGLGGKILPSKARIAKK